MTLEKAIEVLEYHEPSLTYDENPDIRLALKLGIEALERVKFLRQFGATIAGALLTGETVE